MFCCLASYEGCDWSTDIKDLFTAPHWFLAIHVSQAGCHHSLLFCFFSPRYSRSKASVVKRRWIAQKHRSMRLTVSMGPGRRAYALMIGKYTIKITCKYNYGYFKTTNLEPRPGLGWPTLLPHYTALENVKEDIQFELSTALLYHYFITEISVVTMDTHVF